MVLLILAAVGLVVSLVCVMLSFRSNKEDAMRKARMRLGHRKLLDQSTTGDKKKEDASGGKDGVTSI